MSPIYDFKCEGCLSVVSVITIGVQTEPVVCVSCGKEMRKLPSAFAVRVGTEVRNPNHPDSVQRANEERRKKGLRADLSRVRKKNRVVLGDDL